MFGEIEWLFTAYWEPCLLLLTVAFIAAISLAALLGLVVLKAYIRVRNFEGPPSHWIKGHLDQVK